MPAILVIDDDKLVREATQVVLVAKGYNVVAVADGEAGIAAAKAGQFDLAIVDLFMPGMNGLKVIEAIRSANPNLPMIAASGFMFGGPCPQMPNFEAMVAEVGALSALYKPFRPNDLLQAVAKAIASAQVSAEPVPSFH
jgi:CheY-like chemotaxis protein